jgi:hypothetical protein
MASSAPRSRRAPRPNGVRRALALYQVVVKDKN